jgi:hypothetical protein
MIAMALAKLTPIQEFSKFFGPLLGLGVACGGNLIGECKAKDLTAMWSENRETDQPYSPAMESDVQGHGAWRKPIRELALLVSLFSALALLAVDNGLAAVVLAFVTIPLVLETLAA